MNKPRVQLTPEEIASSVWVPFPEGPEGMWERVLVEDRDSGSYTRLIKADAGLEVGEVRVHDFWEESWILEGSFEEEGKVYGPGSFTCNPPGFPHGPYTTETGWIALEWVYYP